MHREIDDHEQYIHALLFVILKSLHEMDFGRKIS